jgi:diacylglycerol O-acyltransferase
MIRKTLGGTVNDVVLAAITSGFRDLTSRGRDPTAVALRTLVPVPVRAESEHGVPNNRVSALFLDLPVHLGDPQERLSAVRREMGRLKESHESEAGEALTAFMGNIPPAVAAQTTRLAARVLTKVQQRRMNTVTTNVPGPPLPLYAVGRKMVEYLPFVPLGPGVRIGVAILSYNGQLAFGVTGDFDTAADISVIAVGIEAEIAKLMALATADEISVAV